MTILDEIMQTTEMQQRHSPSCHCSGCSKKNHGPNCQCAQCKEKEIEEEYFLGSEFDWLKPMSSQKPNISKEGTSTTSVVPAGSKPCPVKRSVRTRKNCSSRSREKCPRLPNLLCVDSVNGIKLRYLKSTRFDKRHCLKRIRRLLKRHKNRFVPATRNALSKFTRDMKRFKIPVKSLIVLGSRRCRCLRDTNTLSNHAFGEAIDLAGVIWKRPHRHFSRVKDTLVRSRNLNDLEQRRLIRRINACLRLSFFVVIDYNYNSKHTNHFHCDMNKSTRNSKRGFNLKGRSTLLFVQEALSLVICRKIRQSGKLDSHTLQALSEYSKKIGLAKKIGLKKINEETLKDSDKVLRQVYMELFEQIADDRF